MCLLCDFHAVISRYIGMTRSYHVLVEYILDRLYSPRSSQFRLRWELLLFLFISYPSFYYRLSGQSFPLPMFKVVSRIFLSPNHCPHDMIPWCRHRLKIPIVSSSFFQVPLLRTILKFFQVHTVSLGLCEMKGVVNAVYVWYSFQYF